MRINPIDRITTHIHVEIRSGARANRVFGQKVSQLRVIIAGLHVQQTVLVGKDAISADIGKKRIKCPRRGNHVAVCIIAAIFNKVAGCITNANHASPHIRMVYSHIARGSQAIEQFPAIYLRDYRRIRVIQDSIDLTAGALITLRKAVVYLRQPLTFEIVRVCCEVGPISNLS